MKNLLKFSRYTLIFLLVILLNSCYKNLDPIEYTNISPANFPSNEEDVIGLVNGAYEPFSSKYMYLYNDKEYGYQSLSDLAGAILDIRWPGRAADTYGFFGMHLMTDNSTRNNQIFYQNIGKLNSGTIILDRLERAKSFLSTEKYNAYAAEVRLSRAWISLIFYDLYGPMPIVPISALLNPTSDAVFPRATDEEYVNYIKEDLFFASANLPYKQSIAGKFYKGLANMLLLKLYMIEKDWPKVKITAEELMKPEYGYSIWPNYSALFSLTGGAMNPEVIYYIPVDGTHFANTWLTFNLNSNYATANPKIEKWGIFMGTWGLWDTYQQGDKRTERMIAEYVGTDGVTYNRANPGAYLLRGPMIQKYAEDPTQTGEYSKVELIVYRYADVLLAWAEAQNHLNSNPDAECWNKLNIIRNRSNAGELNFADYSTEKAFDDLILAERLREFPLEGLSRQDLIRHNRFDVNTYYWIDEAQQLSSLIVGTNYQDSQDIPNNLHHRCPLPKDYIAEGKGVVIQNPGY